MKIVTNILIIFIIYTPCLRPGAAARRSHPVLEARDGSWEEPPHTQGQGQQLGGTTRGAVAARAQEGLEVLSHVEGQEGQW